jgi:hypothetical protein
MLLLLFACGSGGSKTGVGGSAIEPSPYIVEEGEAPEPLLRPEEVAVAIEMAMDAVLDVDANPVLDAYAAAMAGGEEGCPDWYSDGAGGVFWYDYCETTGGNAFEGYGSSSEAADYTDSSGVIWDYRSMYAEAWIRTDGSVFAGTGYSAQWNGYEPSEKAYIWQSNLSGSFTWDGPGIDGTWMAAGLRPELYYWISSYPSSGAAYIGIFGGLSQLEDETVDTVAMDDVQIFDWGGGAPCAVEPVGMISVRDAEGGWYDVAFDVEESGGDPMDCDGCGSVWFRGEIIGEACVDATRWLDEVRSW